MRTELASFADAPKEVPKWVTAQVTCSQGLSGTVTLPDGTRKRVMVTAAHCIHGVEGDADQPVPEVYAPLLGDSKLIGVRDRGAPIVDSQPANTIIDPVDWSTVALRDDVKLTRVADSVDHQGRRHGKPVVLTSVKDHRDLREGEVSFDNFGQPICKDGQTSGRTCGVQFMRTQNGVWFAGLVLSGDSGGINFNPVTGEAIGVTSLGFLGLLARAQPIDTALEAAYGIPDGKVNERFSLPESTEPHTPMRTLSGEAKDVDQWVQANRAHIPWVQEKFPENVAPEPIDMEAANSQAAMNFEAGLGEITAQVQDTVNLIHDNPADIASLPGNYQKGGEFLNKLVQNTVEGCVQAFENQK